MGQVLLASLPTDELERYLRTARPARFTAKTRVSRREIEARLEEVRRQGYALADQELEEGLAPSPCPCATAPAEPWRRSMSAHTLHGFRRRH